MEVSVLDFDVVSERWPTIKKRMLSKALLDEKYHHDYLHFDGAKLRLTSSSWSYTTIRSETSLHYQR